MVQRASSPSAERGERVVKSQPGVQYTSAWERVPRAPHVSALVSFQTRAYVS